ncbi:MAG: DUF87 domain-containing protein [Deltaproteobacteria bacterium]|nr:DUF87 domain-containing protein [Deltaproteobacteria bacterium]
MKLTEKWAKKNFKPFGFHALGHFGASMLEQPLENRQILLEPPSEKDSKETYLLGDIIYNKKKLHQLHLKPEDFLKQIGIFAITGEGKTNLAYLLALQLLESKTPFMVIDWKRSWRNLLSLENKHPELKNVQVLTLQRHLFFGRFNLKGLQL